MGLNIQTPKGNIGGHGLLPTSTTNASTSQIMELLDNKPPQTPAGLGGKVPALDMAKVAGALNPL